MGRQCKQVVPQSLYKQCMPVRKNRCVVPSDVTDPYDFDRPVYPYGLSVFSTDLDLKLRTTD